MKGATVAIGVVAAVLMAIGGISMARQSRAESDRRKHAAEANARAVAARQHAQAQEKRAAEEAARKRKAEEAARQQHQAQQGRPSRPVPERRHIDSNAQLHDKQDDAAANLDRERDNALRD